MSNKLKAITTRAKQLYKTGKFSKWTDAIKEASKSLTKGKKVNGYEKTEKHGTTTKVVYSVSPKVKKAKKNKTAKTTKQLMIDLYGKNNPLSHYKSLGNIKKKATKKKATPKSYHKDTKSHNVKISVVSGVSEFSLLQLKRNNESIERLSKVILDNKNKMSLYPYKTTFWKNYFKKKNKEINDYIKTLKKQNTALKKHI